MKNFARYIITLFSLSMIFLNTHTNVTFKTTQNGNDSLHITASIDVSENELLYKKYINFSVDNPKVTLSPWKSSKKTDSVYDHSTKKDILAYRGEKDKPIEFSLDATKKDGDIGTAYVNFSYYLNTAKKAQNESLQLLFPKKATVADKPKETISETGKTKPVEHSTTQKEIDKPKEKLEDIQNPHKESRLSDTISDLLEHTNSIWIRLLLALLLGLLLSLTPCIYPMIPITIGIVQGQASKSVIRNFFISFGYTLGLATTFAIFGLLAALGGNTFGSLVSNPIFVVILVLFLSYLALSMFGFYDVYIPSFLQPKQKAVKGGSFVAALLLGVAMGTMASPCLSPGLVLLLSVVATLKNWMLGFALLFCFGIGVSSPLLLIGTFSGSINMLPRAGSWMNEVKKLFGLLLFGMCFYYLKNIVSWNILIWFVSGFMFLAGAYYFINAKDSTSPAWKKIKNILGFIFIVVGIAFATQSYKETFYAKEQIQEDFWHTNYFKALEIAKKEKKNVFVDFWAEHCAVCMSRNKTVLKDKDVVKVLKEKYKLFGLPAFLLIDPTTEKVEKKWTTITKEDIISDVK
ncbi:hypothetical protein HN446_01370 [bacterium]|nr:hypothetical protein [bacterium]